MSEANGNTTSQAAAKVLHLKKSSNGRNYSYANDKRKTIPGSTKALQHDKDLKTMQNNKSVMTLFLLSGIKVEGIISASDKFTIKIKTRCSSGNPVERTYFKHGIESFAMKNEA